MTSSALTHLLSDYGGLGRSNALQEGRARVSEGRSSVNRALRVMWSSTDSLSASSATASVVQIQQRSRRARRGERRKGSGSASKAEEGADGNVGEGSREADETFLMLKTASIVRRDFCRPILSSARPPFVALSLPIQAKRALNTLQLPAQKINEQCKGKVPADS